MKFVDVYVMMNKKKKKNGTQAIAPEENCPSVRVRVSFRVEAIFLGGNCPRTVSNITQTV